MSKLLGDRWTLYLGGILQLLIIFGLFSFLSAAHNNYRVDYVVEPSDQQLTETENANHAATKPKPKPKPKPIPKAIKPEAKLPFIFGVGTELDKAISLRVTKEAPIKMLTSWFNGTKDLGFMKGWRTSYVPTAYKKGYALHLIIYSNDSEQNISTKYGTACGRPYPLSGQFLADAKQLATIYRGGRLYVSMFTELQTYPCSDNTWATGKNYYQALQDQYMAALKIFHQYAPGSQVSLSWGGWQAEWDDVGQGGGRSLFKKFASVMNASDFQSFQAMSTTNNLAIITDMTKALSPYTGGVMVAHYKPDNGSQGTFDSDMRNIFTSSNITSLQQNGLFAFSFMDSVNMNNSTSSYVVVRNIVRTFGK